MATAHSPRLLNALAALVPPDRRRSVLVVHGSSGVAIPLLLEMATHWRITELTAPSDRQTVSVTDVVDRLQRVRRAEPSALVAIGGGRVIDFAKLVKFGVEMESGVAAALPLVAVPTTAGSGSEATRFATYYDGWRKRSLEDRILLPNAAVLIPRLLYNAPVEVLASAGLDALSHGIEATWSNSATPTTVSTGLRAIQLVADHLLPAVLMRSQHSLERLLFAANLAGRAINQARTTAGHGFSYALTSVFGVAHGHAVAVMMQAIINFNGDVSADDCAHHRGPDYVNHTNRLIWKSLGVASALEASRRLGGFLDAVGFPRYLDELGVTKDHHHLLVESGLSSDRSRNNPRQLTLSAARELVRVVYRGT